MGQTITFMNNKGGCGKTTTVCAVGEHWALLGKKILLIDLDSQASLTSIITDTDGDQEWDRTIENAFIDGPDVPLPIVHVKENLDIIPADLELSDFNDSTASQKMREWMLADLLATVKDQYDFILIDCPPALGLIAYNALVAADWLVIVTNAEGTSYRGVKMIMKLYNDVRSNVRLNPNLSFLGVVVTRFEKNNISNKYWELLKDAFKIYLIEPPIRKSTKLVQAASFQTSIFELDPKGRATEDYVEVAEELIKRALLP